ARVSWLPAHLMCVWLTDCEFLRSYTDTHEKLGAADPRPACLDRLSRRLADRDFQRADAVDPALNLVAGRERGHAGWRSRHDDIAGAERNLLRELGDDLWHAPDQFGQVALLPLGAIHRKPDLAVGGVPDLRCRLQR